MVMRWWGKNEALWRLLLLLFLGQLLSFFLALIAFTTSLVASLGVNTPLSLSFLCYLALALVYGSVFLYRRQKPLIPWYWYMALGFVDVQGNFLVNKAYQFSSITSVTLLDCCTIAWAIGLTWYFIGTKYSLCQLLGAAICVIGLGLVFLSDSGASGGGGSRPLLGDFLVIAGTIFYGMSNVGQKKIRCITYLVPFPRLLNCRSSVSRKTLRIEVLSMLGLFGTLISICEISVVEKKSLESVKWTVDIILAFAGNALAGFLFYNLTPFVLKMGGATLFNLSLLTSDMWAVVIRIFIYHQQVDWLYFVSFAIVSVGLIIYSISEKDQALFQTLEDGTSTAEYQELSEESEESQI